MNEAQRQNIKQAFKDWSVQCIRRKAFPVILIGISDSNSALVWKGGQYTNHQVKKILRWIADEIPGNDELFEDVGVNK